MGFIYLYRYFAPVTISPRAQALLQRHCGSLDYFKAPQRRQDFLLGRLLAIWALKDRGVTGDFYLQRHPDGYPELSGEDPQLAKTKLSIAHCPGIIAVALSPGLVGVDCELPRRLSEPALGLIFSAQEHAEVGLSAAASTALFAAKEAYLKAVQKPRELAMKAVSRSADGCRIGLSAAAASGYLHARSFVLLGQAVLCWVGECDPQRITLVAPLGLDQAPHPSRSCHRCLDGAGQPGLKIDY